MLEHFTDSDWYQNFRMTKEAFLNLCGLLSPYVQNQNTVMKFPVPLQKRVALTLYRLASCVEFHDLANLFGTGVSTACNIFWEVCEALCCLKKKIIKRPRSLQELQLIIDGFEEKSRFPMCAGALDGTHIPIIAPSQYCTDYYNRKGWYSVQLQGLVDHKYRFMDFDVSWPGKCHDSFVFENSKLCHKLENDTFFPLLTRSITGVEIQPLIVADSAYSLSPHVMKPFPDGTLNGPQKEFNACLSRARINIEHAFGRLKGRWRCIMKRNDSATNNIRYVMVACIVLHNFCEEWNQEYVDTPHQPPENTDPALDITSFPGEPELTTCPEPPDALSCTAEEIRQAIMLHVSTK